MKYGKNIRKILAVILSAIMLLSVVPMSVFAEEDNYVAVATAANGTVTWYSDLAWAFYAAQHQDITVKLLKDVDNVQGSTDSQNQGFTLSDENGNVTLDLNGHYIKKCDLTDGTANNSNAFFYVTNGTKLTVTDSIGGGEIIQTVAYPAFIIDNNASLTVDSGTITSNKSAGIRVDGGSLTVTGNPKIHGESSNAVLVTAESTVALSGGTYTTNEKNKHSIWTKVGKVEDLLPDGFKYTDANGKVVGNADSGSKGNGTDSDNVTVSDYSIKYIDADGNEQKCTNYTEITADTVTGKNILSEGWHVVKDNIDGWKLGINGNSTVNVILCDGASLSLPNTLYMFDDATLNIYGQSEGTGRLIVELKSGGYPAIGISNGYENYTASVNFYGGTVTAKTCTSGPQTIGVDKSTAIGSVVNVKLGANMKCVKTDDLNTPYAYDNTDSTSITITKCNEHKWVYSNKTDDTHDRTCELCNAAETGIAHTTASYYQGSTGQIHYLVCACGKMYKQESHNYTYTPNDDGLTHTRKCVCGLTVTSNHSYDSKSCYYCKAEIKATYNGTKYARLQSAIDAAARDNNTVNATVTLYADLVAEDVVVNSGDITIDLNGKEWKTGLLNGSSCVPLTVNGGTVTLKNGNLFQGSASSTAASGIVVNGGALVLHSSVRVSGGTWDSDVVRPSITVNGGELELIPGAALLTGLKVPEGKVLADYLFKDEDMGTAFVKCTYDGEGTIFTPDPYEYVADVYTSNETFESMTAVWHNHDIGENDSCECGWNCDAQITYSDGTTEFIEKLDGKTLLEQDSKVKLLRDTTISYADTHTKRLQNIGVLDLNGHTITCDKIAIANDVTVKNSSDNFGIIDGELSFFCANDDYGPRITVEENNIKIKSLNISSECSVKLKGGIFGKISYAEIGSDKIYPALEYGYGFKKANYETGEIAEEFETNAYSSFFISNVAVVPHYHEYAADSKGVCACGYTCKHTYIDQESGKCRVCGTQYYVVELTTKDGKSKKYTFADGWAAAIKNEGSTLQLICDVDIDTEDSFSADSGKFTFDLNGKTFSTCAMDALFTVEGTADITIKNGNLVNTVNYDYDGIWESNIKVLNVSGGKVTLDGVELTAGIGNDGKRSYSVIVSAGELSVKGSTFTGAVAISNTETKPEVKITSATLNDGIFYMFAGEEINTDAINSLFAEGSMLFDENGKYIDVASTAYWKIYSDQGMTVFKCEEKHIVKPHTHTMVDNYCSECDFYCEHKDIDENCKCKICGAQVYVVMLEDSKFEYLFKTFEDAWAAACKSEGSTLTLFCDVEPEYNDIIVETSSGKFTIDLNGHTLQTEALNTIISVSDTAEITIKNGKIINNYYGEAGNGQFPPGSGNAIEMTGGSVTLENVELTGGEGEYDFKYVESTPIHINDSGNLTASGCTLNGTLLIFSRYAETPLSIKLASTKLEGISYSGVIEKYDYNLINGFFAEGNVLLDNSGKYVDTTSSEYWTMQEISADGVTILLAAFTYSGEATVTPHTHNLVKGVCDSCGYECKHTGGKATYFKKAICDICGTEYGDYAPDTTAPTGKITINEIDGWKQVLSDITFGLFFKDDVEVEITAEDDGYSQPDYDPTKHAVKIEYFISNKILDEDTVKAAEFKAYDGKFGLADDENYVVYAKLTDFAGNVTVIGSDGFAIDTTAPEIVGYKDGETVNACGALTITINDSNLDKVYRVGWGELTSSDGKYTLDIQPFPWTITATDKAGNSTTVTFDIKSDHDFDFETKKCNHCGQNALVEQTIDGETKLYDSYDKAMSALDRVSDYESTELKLLGDIVEDEIVWGGSKRILNLNGHTLSIKPSDSEENGELYLSNSVDVTIVGGGILDADLIVTFGGTLTVDNAGGKITKLTQNSGTLKVLSGTVDEFVVAKDASDTNEIITELCGGSYGSIKIGFDGLTCADLLKAGYCYKGVKYEDAKVTELNNAEVVLCEHNDIQSNGYCPDCGQIVKATVELGGETQIFETLESAIAFAEQNEGSVIKLAVDITLNRHSSLCVDRSINLTKGTYTIDLNGKTLNLEKDSAASEPLSQLKIADDCHLTIADSKGGGKVTTGTIDAGTAAQIYDDAHLTVTGGDFTAIENFKVGLRGNLTLSGGSFRKIYTFASRKAELKSPMDFLAEGYLYKIGDRFATADDIQFMQDDPNTGARYENYIENVSVVPVPEFNFSQYSLSVANNLTLNFGLDSDLVNGGYFTNIYAVFTIAGNTVKVDKYNVKIDKYNEYANPKYEFSLVDINPNQMNDTVTAQLFGEHDGKEVSSDIKTVTIANYLYKLLDTEESAKLKTLVVDMLNYGASAQIYTNRNTDNLANAKLTDEQKAFGTAEKPELKKITNTKDQVIDNPTVSWETAGVTLKNAVTLRFGFKVEDDNNINDLYVKITAGSPANIPADKFIKKADGSYYVELDDIHATELSDGVFVTVYNRKDKKPVSNTLRYSVESYAYTMQNSSDTKLADLVIALMKYGNSAIEYNKEVQGW